MVDSVFDNCSALTGGTFELVWSVVVIQNVTFRNSISLQEGGVGEAYGGQTRQTHISHLRQLSQPPPYHHPTTPSCSNGWPRHFVTISVCAW